MALLKSGFIRVFLIYTRQKLHTGKNQKLPFYKNKGINAHFFGTGRPGDFDTASHVGVNEPCTQDESFSQYHSMASLSSRTARNL